GRSNGQLPSVCVSVDGGGVIVEPQDDSDAMGLHILLRPRRARSDDAGARHHLFTDFISETPTLGSKRFELLRLISNWCGEYESKVQNQSPVEVFFLSLSLYSYVSSGHHPAKGRVIHPPLCIARQTMSVA